MFWCPGCDIGHGVNVNPNVKPCWGWNNDVNKPTFTPSILVRYNHWVPPYVYGQPKPENQQEVKDVCHSFVKDGQIQFLNDCTHSLAGKTVDLPEWTDVD